MASRSPRTTIFLLLLAVSLPFVCGCTDYGGQGVEQWSSDIPGGEAGDAVFNTPVQSAFTGEDESGTGFALQRIQPVMDGAAATEPRMFPVKFETREYEIDIDVNRSVYEGARTVDKALPAEYWYDEYRMLGYYSSFIGDPAIVTFLDDVLSPLERIRRSDNLNDEEFLELMVTFVQQIPYDSGAPVYPRYPVEVIYDGKGDCDEKSLLLLGMLSRAGYDAALLLFPEMHHATAGIRISTNGNPPFRTFTTSKNEKYFYIETTVPTYIGLYSENYEDAEAFVVPLGNGEKRFTRVNYVCHITESYQKIADRLVFMEATMAEWKQEIEDMKSDLQYGTYDTQDAWDDDYASYTALVGDYNSYVEKYRKYAEIYVYIRDRPYDIAGVYRRIENSNVMDITI
ncbi:MAG: hypothetical protein APR53_09130 [Methanoculleus sp. SDB]|nr:MAG: hypothetical protein APR53_09130 [Methanoculleus sp. SDB]